MAISKVTSGGIAADIIDGTKIADNAVDTEHLADDAVDSAEIAAGAIDAAHMSANSIDSDSYVDGSIDAVHLSANSVDSDAYVDGSIDNAHLADDAVGIAELSATGTASSSTYLRGDNSWATVTSVGGATGVDFNDNVKARFGTGNDLEIYHDASHSFISDQGTGSLKILANTLEINNAANNEAMAGFAQDGAVTLYHNDAAKIATASDGIVVTGDISGSSNGAVTYDFFSDWAGMQIAVTSNHYLAFKTNNTERLRITSDGRGLSQFTAKAWCNFDGTGTPAFRDSHNCSSITDHGTGEYSVNFTNDLANANFSVVGSCGSTTTNPSGRNVGTVVVDAGACRCEIYDVGNASHYDMAMVFMQVFGD